MNVVNPLYVVAYNSERVNTNYVLKKDVDRYSLYLSFIKLFTFIGLMFLSRILSNTILLIGFISSFILMIVFYILFIKNYRNVFIGIMYIILSSAFLSFLSNYLYNILDTIYSSNTLIENPYRTVFLNISISIVLFSFMFEILNILNAFVVNHFYIKYLIYLAFVIFLSVFINFLVYKIIGNHNLIMNTLFSIFIGAFNGLFLLIYTEESRRIIEEGIDKSFLFLLSMLKETLLVYIVYESVNSIIKHK